MLEEKAVKDPWNKLSNEQKRVFIGHLNAKEDNRDQAGQLFYNVKAALLCTDTPANKT